ncbi:MAG TPA: hypothetical protein VHC22_17645 [Pirellulales bacterium]|nr:hypothetical protein [Pirellulales bacterium]
MSFDQWRIALVVAAVILAVIATYSLAGLVAVWSVRGRGHWFWKTAAVLTFPALWLFTSDPRLCLFLLSEIAVVLMWFWTLEGRSDRTTSASTADGPDAPRGGYSLASLLLAFVLLSGVLAMLARLPPEVRWDWYQDVVPGGMMGAATIVAVWIAESKRSAWLRALVLVIAFPAFLMGAWLWLARSARGPFGRATAVAALVLIAVLPARVYYIAFKDRSLAYPPPLANNGYVDLLRAGAAIDNLAANIDTLPPDELRAYLSKQQTALELVRSGLAIPCQAVLHEGMNDKALWAEGNQFEKLSQVLAAQARQELQDGHVEAAVENYLADIELGAAMTHGGVMMHDGFGFVSERLGIEGLQQIVSRLDDDACRKLEERLLEIDADREPTEASRARERLYFSRSYPWKHRIHILTRAFAPNEAQTDDILMVAAGGEKRARVRLLACHLALRRFWLSTNGYPQTLDELVPRYLASVPLDPFADHVLMYKKLPTGYLLYSIGDDRVDDSGTPSAPFALPVPKGDIVVAVVLPAAKTDVPNEIETGASNATENVP